MSVKLAKTAGFCMGVKRAVDMVLELAQNKGGQKFYTYGPLIHNPQTIELLEQRGITPLMRIDDINQDEEGTTIIIRAHGISPGERNQIKSKGIRIIDATCPKVAHVQAIIKKHASREYQVLIVGDPEHPEVNGLLGYAQGKGVVISNKHDIDCLPAYDKVCVVAQTTQSQDEYATFVALIKAKYPDTVIFETICDSTEKRQTEVKALAKEMDVMVIVGGKNSANTMRLAKLSELEGTPTHQIETADELQEVALSGYARVGISAGASTPNWIIDRVVDNIKSGRNGQQGKFRGLYKLWAFLVRSDIYAAIGAACLSFASMLLQRIPVQIIHILTTSLFVFAMHTLNRLINRKTSSILGSFREESYQKHEHLYVYVAILAMAAALLFSYLSGAAAFVLLFLISLSGMLYNAKILPTRQRFESLKDLPGSKNLFMAAAWAAVAAVLPQMERVPFFKPDLIVAFLFVFSVVFIRSAMSDMLDIQSDKLIGRETIPVLIGKDKTQRLLKIMLWFLLIMLLIAYPAGWSSSVNFALLTSLFYMWICFKLCDRRAGLSGIVLEGLLETSYIIIGISSLLWFMCFKMI